MAKSEFSQNLDAVQAAVHTFLKPLGFCKRGRVHNRRVESGLIHVISLQMGETSLQRKFAINLGVLLPYVFQIERQRALPEVIHEYDCTIRERLGRLTFGKDEWFDLRNDTAALATTVVRLLDKHGLEFLDQFKTYQAVLSYYQASGSLPFQTSNRASLEAALVAHHIGDDILAKTLFAKARDTGREGFQGYVAEIEKRIETMVDLPVTTNKN